ncbi:hypothetical protein MRX96_006379 [Rhipicephalus microplus]
MKTTDVSVCLDFLHNVLIGPGKWHRKPSDENSVCRQ